MNFIEESNKYIFRGLVYLLGWFLVMPVLFAGVGGALLGVGGLLIGILLSAVLGIWGYSAYLEWSYRKMMRRSEELHPIPYRTQACDGSTECASPAHIEGCFSTNPDYRSQA